MLVIDTGVLVAAADRNDPAHQPCADLLARSSGPLVTTGLVIAEAAYLIQRELGVESEALLFEAIAAGSVRVMELTVSEWTRVHELVTTYEDLPSEEPTRPSSRSSNGSDKRASLRSTIGISALCGPHTAEHSQCSHDRDGRVPVSSCVARLSIRISHPCTVA